MLPGEWFGARHVEWHDEIDSTNNRAALLAADSQVPLPALVVADRQTAGRGRGANRWWSSAGALTFSLVVDAGEPALPAQRWPLVSLGAALALKEVLDALVPAADVRLKWPNDVYVAGRKIAGILVEAPPVRPARLVVGIGLNVNNSLLDAPEEIHARATSLIDRTGATFDRETLLSQIVERLLAELALVGRDECRLVERWTSACLLGGKTVWIDVGPREVVGRCHGIDASGALLVQTALGPERLFAGVVKRWE